MSKKPRIAAGTANPAKLKAVKKAMRVFYQKPVVVPNAVESGVPKQPFGWKQTVQGAKNRARAAWRIAHQKTGCDFSVGMEAGLVRLPGGAWLDVGACAIFDGKKFGLGFAPAFEIPARTIEWIKRNDSELGPAAEKLFGGKKNLGQHEGVIGLFTHNTYSRAQLWEHAVRMALVPFLNKPLFL